MVWCGVGAGLSGVVWCGSRISAHTQCCNVLSMYTSELLSTKPRPCTGVVHVVEAHSKPLPCKLANGFVPYTTPIMYQVVVACCIDHALRKSTKHWHSLAHLCMYPMNHINLTASPLHTYSLISHLLPSKLPHPPVFLYFLQSSPSCVSFCYACFH